MQDEGYSGEPYLAGFDDVFAVEIDEIRKHTSNKEFDPEKLEGIAISGGGIRSASFAVGALQNLADAGCLGGVDYLSTVSGGGYAGASLTWFWSGKAFKGDPHPVDFGMSKQDFPFLGDEAAALRRDHRKSTAEDQAIMAGSRGGRSIVDFIRQRSSYLLPGGSYGLASAIAIVLRSMLVSIIAYLALFTLLGWGIIAVDIPSWTIALPGGRAVPGAFGVAFWLLVLLPVSAVAYSLVAAAPRWATGGSAYRLRRFYQRWAGWVLGLGIVSALFGVWLLGVTQWRAVLGIPLPTAAAASTVGGAILGAVARKLLEAAPGILARYALVIIPPIALLLLLMGLGAGGYWVAEFAMGRDWSFPVVAAACLFYLLYANINLTGLHRFYRDRLMEAVMPDSACLRRDAPNARTSADQAELSDMYGAEHKGPYHLINTNVVLLEAKTARYRSRRSDSFVLAPLFCGSEATGWALTREWLAERRSGFLIRPPGPITLPTAMAISGAAVNPNTGADGKGVTTGAAVSALLTILNIRLGYWVSSPKRLEGGSGKAIFYPPNHLVPGLLQGLLGFGRSERSGWLEITDGGHFDNTGIYELVRRRLKTIYFIDGTEDPDVAMTSFANAAEKIYIDFGVTIEFSSSADFAGMMKGSSPITNPLKKYELAERGFAVAKLIYPKRAGGGEEPPGILFYIKSTLTDDLPASLYAYKAQNPLFPAESTGDQFFSEQQFEAYRTLGFAVSRQLTGRDCTNCGTWRREMLG